MREWPSRISPRLREGQSGLQAVYGGTRRMRVHDNRLAMTARYLEAEALDGLVAVNFGQNSFLESHAAFVLSGVRPIGESAVVVDRSGGSTLIVTPAWDAERATTLSHTEKT